MREGPEEKITYFCKGCVFLYLNDWEINNEVDMPETGTDAFCIKADKLITSFYYEEHRTPKWCPYLKDQT